MYRGDFKYQIGAHSFTVPLEQHTMSHLIDAAAELKDKCDERFRITAGGTGVDALLEDDAQALLDWIGSEEKAHSRVWIRRMSPLKSAPRTDRALDHLIATGAVELRTTTYLTTANTEKIMQGAFLPHWEGGIKTGLDMAQVASFLTYDSALTIGEISSKSGMSRARVSLAVSALIKEKRARRTEDGKGVYLG